VSRRHPHPEHQEACGQDHDAVQAHRPCDDHRARERHRKAELDSGLAAIGVGDLADRVGHQEAAQPEQAD
jgi:hypothetical protein